MKEFVDITNYKKDQERFLTLALQGAKEAKDVKKQNDPQEAKEAKKQREDYHSTVHSMSQIAALWKLGSEEAKKLSYPEEAKKQNYPEEAKKLEYDLRVQQVRQQIGV